MFCKEMYEKLAPPQGSVSRGVGSSGGGGGRVTLLRGTTAKVGFITAMIFFHIMQLFSI